MSLRKKAGKILHDAYKAKISKTSGNVKLKIAKNKARLLFARKLFSLKNEKTIRGLAARTCISTFPRLLTNPSPLPSLNLEERNVFYGGSTEDQISSRDVRL